MIALKIYFINYANGAYNEQIYGRLWENAKAAEQIHHPNVVQIFDSGVVENIFYVVTQFIKGNSLAELSRQMGPISAPDALYLTKQVAAGLQAAHDRGILHLDIKPSNIFITEDEEVKLCDFGLGLPVENAEELLGNRVILGSPLYMAPEHISGGNLDPRTDLYSLGITLFQLLTGIPPYESTSPAKVLEQHLAKPVPSARSYNPNISDPVDQLLAMLIAKRPENRIPSAADLDTMIEELITEVDKGYVKTQSGDIPDDVEDFVMNRIAQSPEERMYIQDMLEAIASVQAKEDIPDEARDLMHQIIIQEFSERFKCPQDIIDKLIQCMKRCDQILQDPKQWISNQLDRMSGSGDPVGSVGKIIQMTATQQKLPGGHKTFGGRFNDMVPSPPAETQPQVAKAPKPTLKEDKDPPSRIIKSSNRIAEVLNANAANAQKAPIKKPAKRERVSSLDPILQEAIDRQEGRIPIVATAPPVPGARKGRSDRKLIKLLLFLFLVSAGLFGYAVYRMPEFQSWIKEQLIELKIVKKPKKIVKIDHIASIKKICTEKKFVKAWEYFMKNRNKIPKNLLRKSFKMIQTLEYNHYKNLANNHCNNKEFFEARRLIKAEKISRKNKKKLLLMIEQRQKFITEGWHGETLPYGMKRSRSPGAYYWKKDKSHMIYIPAGKFFARSQRN